MPYRLPWLRRSGVSSSRSSVIKSAIKYLAAIILLGLVIGLNWGTDDANGVKLKPGLKHLKYDEMRVDFLLLATVLYVGIILCQYVRWWMLVQALGLPFRLRDAFRLGMVGTFYNTFLPGSIGGDFVKAYFIAKDSPQRKAAAWRPSWRIECSVSLGCYCTVPPSVAASGSRGM